MAGGNAGRACHDGKNVVHGYQLPWMSPWQTSYRRAKPACNPVSVGGEIKQVKGENNAAEYRHLIGGPKFDGRWLLQREEMNGYEEDRESGNGPCIRDGNGRPERARQQLLSRSARNAPPKTETSVKGHHLPSKSARNASLKPETSLKGYLIVCPLVPRKSPRAVEQKDLAASTPVLNDFVKSPSNLVPVNGRDKGKTVMPQFKGGPHEESKTYELSSETLAMIMDDIHQNNLPGIGPSQPNQCFKDSQNTLTSPVATTMARGKTIAKPENTAPLHIDKESGESLTMARGKTIAKSVNTAPLDMNKESDEPLTVASPVGDRETSQSKTHSLDVEQLFSDADGHAKLDPRSKWVKRIKLCTLGSAHGTKNEKIGEASSREKENNISSKIVEVSKASFEAKIVGHAEKEMVPDPPATALPNVVPDPPATALPNGESSLTEAKKTVFVTLSHPWVQRWINNRSACSQKRHESAELREPMSSKQGVQKRQFPSIAALAMVGKAINNLNPPEHTRKGHVIVWNTKGL